MITTVRTPLMHVKSQFEHDIKQKRYPSPDAKLFGNHSRGYHITNPQARHLLPNIDMTYTALKTHFRQFLAVGIIDYPLHTMCLFMHKINATVFDACFCDNPTFNVKKNENTRVSTVYKTTTLNTMYAHTRKDALLYSAAFAVFVESLEELERVRGVSLIRCL